MKKMLFTAGAALAVALGALSTSNAQLTENWAINVGDQAWFANDSNTRGIGYDPVTDQVLVVSRTGGVSVQVLNPATGAVGTPLNVTGISSGTFALNDVDVTDEGVVYGVNLAVAGTGTGSLLRVYRWADLTVAPVIVFEEADQATRLGDTFAVRGIDSDNSTEIIIGGNGSANLKRLVTADNGATFTIAATNGSIPTGQTTSWGGIMLRRENSNIVLATLGNPVREIQIDGTIVDTHDGAIIGASFGYGSLFYSDSITPGTVLMGLQVGNVGANPAFGRVFDITAGVGAGEPTTAFNTPDMGSNSNGNGAGGVVFTDASNMIVLSTNNRIGSYGSATDFGVNKYAVSNVSDWSMF